jgi:hypothetical protein
VRRRDGLRHRFDKAMEQAAVQRGSRSSANGVSVMQRAGSESELWLFRNERDGDQLVRLPLFYPVGGLPTSGGLHTWPARHGN